MLIVDDGSRTPLEPPRPLQLDVKVVRQRRRGAGRARARNAGAGAAAHDLLLFLDQDMLPEAGWLAAHARWHHAAGDILTQGPYAYVDAAGVEPAGIRERCGSLRELFASQRADSSFVEPHLARTRDLTTRDDDLFRIASTGNLGVGRAFFELLGGFDESFTRWGGEDTEFGWRAWTRGGVLVPVAEAFAWHQGRHGADRARKERSLARQRVKLAHLIAHEDFRASRPGCFFAVPRFVVNVGSGGQCRRTDCRDGRTAAGGADARPRGAHCAAGRDAREAWLEDRFGPDPRVRVAPRRTALDEFPAAPFHVALPAGVRFARGLPERLRAVLGPAVTAAAGLPDGSRVSITRAWALHRARRTGRRPADFGDVIAVSARRVRIAPPPGAAGRGLRRAAGRLRGALRPAVTRLARVRTPREAYWFLEWLAAAVRWGRAKHRRARLGRDAGGVPRPR